VEEGEVSTINGIIRSLPRSAVISPSVIVALRLGLRSDMMEAINSMGIGNMGSRMGGIPLAAGRDSIIILRITGTCWISSLVMTWSIFGVISPYLVQLNSRSLGWFVRAIPVLISLI
jgi:hypothetical protein